MKQLHEKLETRAIYYSIQMQNTFFIIGQYLTSSVTQNVMNGSVGCITCFEICALGESFLIIQGLLRDLF